jgi:MFS family permease
MLSQEIQLKPLRVKAVQPQEKRQLVPLKETENPPPPVLVVRSSHSGDNNRSTSSCWSPTTIIVVMAFLANLICYADRTNLSVAIIVIAKEKNWDDGAKGVVLAAFFYGYPFTGMVAGWASGKWGGDRVLLWGVFGWSLLTLVTPTAVGMGMSSLIVCRILMGLAEAAAGPAIHGWIGAKIPESARTRAITTVRLLPP